MAEAADSQSRDDPERLVAGYAPLPGVADELMDGQGRVRPVWRNFLSGLSAFGDAELAASMARGTQYLRDAGVFFRHYGPERDAERDWPLSHLPLLIDEAEWSGICAGLSQRADLLEQVMADIYGPAKLVADGVLPAELLAANPEWLRPVVGVRPPSGHFLHFIAFDIGRGPDGAWWVLGDRTQAPSGAGFALETRLATARSFPDLMARANVHRLAGFFRDFRDALHGLRGDNDSRIGILTPGPLNDTYFEHAYIARYLGILLVQGEDLTVRNGELMVRTVGGLKPISVLWRRLDSQWSDPQELEESSQLGTPGLLGAVRSGHLTMVNAIGSGALEIRALMAFMPRIAEHLTGRGLALPNIATRWCGDPKARDAIEAGLGRMTIDNALSTRPPFDHGEQVVIAGKTVDGYSVNPAWIDQEAGRLAAQEIVSLSTAPVLHGGRLQPRPMSLRVFLARTQNGWSVMPGGLARIGHTAESADIAMQRGGAVSDVWIVSDKPPEPVTLLGAGEVRRQPLGVLPSRAADNLFWLGRYMERAEQHMRLARAYHLRLAESGLPDLPVNAYLAKYAAGQGLDLHFPVPPGLQADLSAAVRSAGSVRDRFSTDGWNALIDLQKTIESFAPKLLPADDAARAMGVLLRKVSGFAGLVHENMYRFTGWRFLTIGRSVERAWATAGFVNAFTRPDAPEGALELAIEAGDSMMTHRRRYAVATSRATVIDLLVLDEMNPRSVLYQIAQIHEHLRFLPAARADKGMTPVMRKAMQLETELATANANHFDAASMARLFDETCGLSGLLTATYLR